MPDEKEVQRLIGIAQEHARAALAKPETQRESHLAFCRLNWKRYAAGLTKSAAERERFAEALDRATRDFMALMQDPAMAARTERLPPWYPLSDDAVEGAMESVVVFEAAIEPEPVIDAPVDLPAHDEPPVARQEDLGDAGVPPLPEPLEHTEARAAEEADRQMARFGFSGGAPREQPAQPAPRADPELKRKIQDLLRARQAAKSDEES